MEVIIVIALWVALGYWASRIMHKKGRSEGAGWALGILLGLLGVLIAALLTPDHEELRQRG